MAVKPRQMKSADVAVIGGGIAGSVAAIHLARAGVKTVLFEKETAAHQKVCGEFVSNEGVELLRECGVDFERLGAVSIRALRMHGPYRSCEANLPLEGRGVSRFALDEELLHLAAASGAEVKRGVLVTDLSSRDPFRLNTSQGEFASRRLILASGKSEFRAVQTREGRDGAYVGFKTHLRLKPSLRRQLRDHIELFVFKSGYGGLSMVEGDVANFCFLIAKSALRSIGTDWNSLAFHIARNNREASVYLDGAEPIESRLATVASIPYGFVRGRRSESGLYCVGDQMAVIPSLTGDGISIAAMTAREAAFSLADLRTGVLRPASVSAVYQRQMRKLLRSQIDSAYQLHRLFKRPTAFDLATYLVSAVPRLVELAFHRTRVNARPIGLKGKKASAVKRLPI